MSLDISQADKIATFRIAIQDATEQIQSALRLNQNIQVILDELAYPGFIACSDGQVLLGNKGFVQKVGGEISPIGRKTEDYMSPPVQDYAIVTDRLLLSGCFSLELEYTATIQEDLLGHYITIKKSLLGAGHPKMAIFGACLLIGTSPIDAEPKRSLYDYFEIFQSLAERDQKIAKFVCLGEQTRAIAELLEVSEKTVENRKAHILATLGLKSNFELVKLLVRIQDNGLSDFGL